MAVRSDPAPSEYRLALDIDFARTSWTGTVEFDLGPDVPTVHLDVDGLTVRAVRRDGRPVAPVPTVAGGRVSIDLPSDRAARVAVDFAGTVGNDLSGMYRSRHGGSYVMTTQCEATGARRIFPCVDRPDRKARVRLTVRTDEGLEVVSNTTVDSERSVDGRRERTFAATPPMATYLFYLGVGRFDHLPGASRHAALRVLTAPGASEFGRFALDAARKVLDACEEYYGIDYPLPKLDLLAIEEHAFGAMENWGAISFQANRLLVDPTSSSFGPRDVLETIAHEIAHQWFGNLVTMSWWDDIWLNESFAALVETRITDRIDPALGAGADFILRVAGMSAAFDGDSLQSTHPVHVPVERPEEIGQIFDEISYGKGSSILAMLEGFLGPEKFRAGVTDYLHRFRFGNARTADLWAALERISGEPVGAIAGPWIARPGLPRITARLSDAGLELTQRRFAYLGAPDDPPWPIPMGIDVDGERRRVMFDRRTTTIPVPAGATVHLNPGAVGFYRTLYAPPLDDRLLEALPHRSGADRWIVLEDLAAFLAAGEVPWAQYARFAEALGRTSDRLVVESLGGTLVSLALAMPHEPAVQRTTEEFFAHQFGRLGPARRSDELPTDRVLRERVSFGRVRVDDGFAAELGTRFSEWRDVDPDLRLATAVGVARSGGAEGYRALRRTLAATSTEADRPRLVRALGWAADPAMLRDSLEFAVGGGVNRSYLMGLLIQASNNPAGRDVFWPWFTERVDRLAEVFRGSGYLPLVIEHATPSMGLGRAEEVRSFFAAHPLPEGTRGVAKGLERLAIAERLEAHLRATISGGRRR